MAVVITVITYLQLVINVTIYTHPKNGETILIMIDNISGDLVKRKLVIYIYILCFVVFKNSNQF